MGLLQERGAAEAAGAVGCEQRRDGAAVPAGLHHSGEVLIFLGFWDILFAFLI